MKSLILFCVLVTLIACSGSQIQTAGPGSGISSESSADVRIVRDEYGVPHIYADSVYGLYYGYGYSIAQDRLFQMEMARRSTQGLVAEVLGPDYLEFDRNARKIFSPASIKKQIAALDPRDKDVFEGYAAGLNAWLGEIQSKPKTLTPKQFLDYGFKPEAWTAYDVVMIFVGTMANRYGDFNSELDNLKIVQTLEAKHGRERALAIFNALNPRYTKGAPTTVPLADWNQEVPDNLSATASSAVESLAGVSFDERLKNYVAFTGPVISGISNCWVLGKEKVSDGNAILVNGPQFGWFAPAYTYSVGMHGAGIDVVGNTPFAYPMVMFGHNESITWGSTWAAGDIVDIFAEQLNPEDSNQYWYKDDWIDMESRTEVIQVLGEQPETTTLYRSVHGPIVHRDGGEGDSPSVAYAKRRSWDGKELETLLAWIYATWAKDYESWSAEAEKSAINVNMYFADVEGNIGYFFGGHYPERVAGHDNRFPAKGDGSMDWQGRLSPALANPHVLNPTGDYLANWNNKPGQGVMNPDEHWYGWSTADRVAYLQDAIEERERFTANQAWDLIEASSFADLHLKYLSKLIDQAVNSVEGLSGADQDSDLNMANQIIQQWDGQSEDLDDDRYYDDTATVIFRTFVAQLIDLVLADDLGDVYPYFSSAGYPTAGEPTAAGTNIQTGFKAVYESLKGRDRLNNSFDLLNGTSAIDVVLESLQNTLVYLAETQGLSIDKWKLAVDPRPYNKKNFLGIPQDFSQQPLMATIEQNRGTENNMIVMKPKEIVGYEVTPPGQNAFVSPLGEKAANFDDQFELYTNFGKKRMWFYPADVAAHKVLETQLMLPAGL